MLKRQKEEYEQTKQASVPDSDKAGMLELPDQKFKISMISMLKGFSVKKKTTCKQRLFM